MYKFDVKNETFEANKEEILCMQRFASASIAKGLQNCYIPDASDREFIAALYPYFPDGFFDGLGRFLGFENDVMAGFWFVRKKAARMIEKMEDKEKGYVLDIFEKHLFAMAVEVERDKLNILNWLGEEHENPYNDKKQIEIGTAELVGIRGYSEKKAAGIVAAMVRFDEMLPDKDDTNLFFPDHYYSLMFGSGFINGIKLVEGFSGETAGYGYWHACQIFSDIGIKPPLLLIGTYEANEIRNEAEFEKFIQKLSDPEALEQLLSMLENAI